MKVNTAKEVIVVDEGVSDLDEVLPLADTAALLHLNVSFNRVGRLQGLERATTLKLLNVNHNALHSLDGVHTLTTLCVLKASHNKLSSLEGVAALAQLTELWISHNKIELPELKWLKPLTKLNTLLVETNPCCKEPSYKMVLLDLLPSLKRLDTTVVSEDMRSRSSAFRSSHEGRALTKEIHRLTPAKGVDTSKQTKPTPPQVPAAGVVKRPASETNQHDDPNPAKQPPIAHTSRATTSAPAPKEKKAASLDDFLKSFPVQEYIPAPEAVDYASVSIADAISGLPVFGGPSKQERVGSTSKIKSSGRTAKPPNPKAMKRVVAAAAPATTDFAVQPVTPSTTAAHFNAVDVDGSNNYVPNDDGDDDIVDMEQYTRSIGATSFTDLHSPEARPEDAASVTSNRSQFRPPATSKSNPSELVVKYAGSNVAAVTVRVDGSAQCRWPNNSIAVTVDKESSPKDGYRVFGTFKDGTVALSFDGNGVGFINYASGKTMLSTSSGGDGLLMSAQNGGIDRQWSKGDPPWPADIAVKLSDHLGVSFSLQDNHEYAIRVCFASNGHRHAVVNGFNEAVVESAACDAILGKPKGPVKKKPPPAKLKHVDLVSAIQKCTAQL